MTMSLTEGPDVKVPVRPGLNRVFVRLPGAGDAIKVRANTAALSVCVAAGAVGFCAAPHCAGGDSGQVSVVNAFLSTWWNARQTFGEGAPQTGSQYVASGTLRGLQSTV